jgi:PAS domain-containing protein
VQRPFATARVVEGARVRAVPVGPAEAAPDGIGFADGIQRWGIEGHFGLVPVARGQIAAGVLVRAGGALRAAVRLEEEFLVVPADRLGARERAAISGVGLPVYDADGESRPHPYLDRWAVAQVVERRREALEREACRAFLDARPEAMLVVDGGLAGLRHLPGAARAIGIAKRHETQFLDGPELEVALTLPAGSRSSVFARELDDGTVLLSWYLRLWPWTDEDLLHGLTRVERIAGDGVVEDADRVSRWLLAERAPIAGRDSRWDRLLYPLHEVETALRAQAGGWL